MSGVEDWGLPEISDGEGHRALQDRRGKLKTYQMRFRGKRDATEGVILTALAKMWNSMSPKRRPHSARGAGALPDSGHKKWVRDNIFPLTGSGPGAVPPPPPPVQVQGVFKGRVRTGGGKGRARAYRRMFRAAPGRDRAVAQIATRGPRGFPAKRFRPHRPNGFFRRGAR